MSGSRADAFEAARRMLDMSPGRLWLEYMRLGGDLPADDLNAYLGGGGEVNNHDHDLIAQALNEHFIDQGSNHPLAYADELPLA